MNYDFIPNVALNLAKIIRAIFGKNRKCLVLDLDNTLWGGVIGDDGIDGIQIGHETPAAEAFTEFQKYVLALKRRGVILAVCSKNDAEIAKSGFTHPDSVLHLENFAAFYANWLPKNKNIAALDAELNIATDSLVFIDDNPAERQLVRDTMPEVAVPEINPADIFSYIRTIEGAGYFEPVTISEDDFKRNDTYRENKLRQTLAASVDSYDDFLISLDMRAEIEKMATDPQYITLYGRLADKFGDNGLISVVIGERQGADVHIILWLMSYRVLKRGMEFAMLDALVQRCAACKKIIGYYLPTKKNKIVENLYPSFGFQLVSKDDAATTWELSIDKYTPQNKFIEVEGV